MAPRVPVSKPAEQAPVAPDVTQAEADAVFGVATAVPTSAPAAAAAAAPNAATSGLVVNLASTWTRNLVFVHLDNRWRSSGPNGTPGLPVMVRKAITTVRPTEIHADPSARLVITIARNLGVSIVEHAANWDAGRGGAIERNRLGIALCTSVLVITKTLADDRYAQNVFKQAAEAGKAGYLLDEDGFQVIDMTKVTPFPYTELDNSPYAMGPAIEVAIDWNAAREA